MKIGLVSPYALTFGGVQEHILNLSKQLKTFGHEVKIIAPKSKESQIEDGVFFVGTGRKIPLWRTIAPVTVGFYPSLRTILAKEKFDILHIHEPSIPTLPMQAMFFSQTTTIVTFHLVRIPRFYYHLWDPYIWYSSRKVDGQIAVSLPSKQFYERYVPGKMVIIPNGVDTARFNPKVQPITAFKDGKINILFVGRFEPRKETHVLVKAFSLLRSRYSNIRLILVGDGPLKIELIKEARGIDDIVFVGNVSPEKLPHYYTTADIFCSPAGEGESFGIVLLEAMASGVPVVAASNRGYRQIITNGENGILFPVSDSEKLSKRLEDLIVHPVRRKQLGKKGFLFAQKYSWTEVAKQIEDFYYKTLKNRNPQLTI